MNIGSLGMARCGQTSSSRLRAPCVYQFLGILLTSITVSVASIHLAERDQHRRLSGSEQHVDSSESLSCDIPINTSCTSAVSRQPGTVLGFSWDWDTPEEVPLSTSVAVGGHYVLVDDNGALWTWGRNDSNGGGAYGSKSMQDSGQMGWPRSATGRGPGLIDSSSRFIAAAAGRYHSAALSEDGQLYTWGLNDFGQLGRDAWAVPESEDSTAGEKETSCTDGWSCHDARVVAVPDAPEKFVAIAAGRYHTTVVSESGKRLTEAFTEEVQPNSKYLSRLTKVDGFEDSDPVVAVAAGYMLWTALTQSGKVYVCGTGFDGYAGGLPATISNGGWAAADQGRFLGRDDIEHTAASFHPTLIDGPPFRALAAGRNAAAAVAVNGSLYTWGSSALGRPPSGTSVGIVQGLDDHKIVKACMGEYHGVAIDDAGQAFVWGSMMNNHGLKDDIEENSDQTAAPLKGMPNCTAITALACGHEHTLLITRPQQSCGEDTDPISPVKEPVTVIKSDTTQKGDAKAAPVASVTPYGADHTSESVSAVAQAAALMLRGKHDSAGAEDTTPDDIDDAGVQLASVERQVVDAVNEAETANTGETDIAVLGNFTAQICQNGAPRPHWIETCDEIPSEVPTLDRAWYGRYQAPTLDKVMRTSQDVFEDVLYPFLPSARSPCYMSIYREVRCLPFFSIIGVSKSGTTDLWSRLMTIPYDSEGPHKFLPFKASGNKGPHFWDEGGHDWGKYTELFSVVSDQVAKDEGPVDTVTVDASSNTFSVSGVSIRGQRYGPSGTLPDEVLLPDVLKATQPESKVVVMLRNPVTRLWSSYWYYGCRYGLYGKTMSADGFHTYAEQKTGVVSKCMDSGKSMRECARQNFGPAQQVVKGLYAAVAPDWMSVYPADQIRWIRMEEYMQDPASAIKSLLNWLALEVPDKSTMEALNNKETGNRGHDANPSIPGCEAESEHTMRDDTKSMLEIFYMPWNDMLSKQLGREMWNYTK